jgi:hypothetical protein
MTQKSAVLRDLETDRCDIACKLTEAPVLCVGKRQERGGLAISMHLKDAIPWPGKGRPEDIM